MSKPPIFVPMMHSIPFRDTGYFSDIICDYLDQKPSIRPFYNEFPTLAGFKKQMDRKGRSFPSENRALLVQRLLVQNENIKLTNKTKQNIRLLAENSTFTITTGHQLNLFTGPLYFIYKIVSAINLASTLGKVYSEHTFVPVYWMASEDHDFDEICFFNLGNEKVTWKTAAEGAVGRLSTKDIEALAATLERELGSSHRARKLIDLFKKAYTEFSTLAAAHRFLVNELFGAYGLVIVDGDDAELKSEFIPQIKAELEHQQSYAEVQKTIQQLVKEQYPIQVTPREINLFYLRDNYRERILKEQDGFISVDGRFKWTHEEIFKEVEAHPEHFSPNVIMRPLYQEVILPNLCYIGGGGELAYWFELKTFFEQQHIPFPILLLRNSVLCISRKQADKMKRLNVSPEELFLDQHDLLSQKTKELSDIEIDFTRQKAHLIAQFNELEVLATKTDKSFIGAVKAQKTKQINGLNHLEKRLLKAQKRKLKDHLGRISSLQDALFPKHGLAERYDNYATAVLAFGEDFIDTLIENLDPLSLEFTVLTLEG
ncbi:bacillithiol biosynthesis cysteine-adding enzyme BshC [Flavobacteriaceae bacterium F08102]|nr:bacillithiol biosynthesis cysteine-adding enzyme BshC [Flavobacteriaceae bacterium F08102]